MSDRVEGLADLRSEEARLEGALNTGRGLEADSLWTTMLRLLDVRAKIEGLEAAGTA